MVTSSYLQPYVRCEIVIKEIDNPSSTKTLQFINRPPREGDATYLPLLRSYSGLSLSVGQDGLPNSGSGSIVIGDAWESLGENRRIFDYFDRYTAINQTVTVYTAIETIGDTDTPSSWTLIYTGKVESYSKGKEDLTFSVSNSILDTRKPVKVLDASTTAGDTVYSVPEESYGKPLPFIFANAERAIVPAYPIRRQRVLGTGNNGAYAYASYMSGFINMSGSASVLIKNRDGEYARASGGSSPQTAVAAASAVTSHGTTEFLCPIDFGINDYLITGFDWLCKGQNVSLTLTGKVKFNLYRHPGTSITTPMTSWELLQSVEVSKAPYQTSAEGPVSFLVSAALPEPEACGGTGFGSNYLRSPYIYGIGIVLTNSDDAGLDLQSANSTVGTYFTRTSDSGGWLSVSSAVPVIYCRTSIITNISGGQDENGLGYSTAFIEPYAGACNCTELEVAVSTEGIKDDSSGTITGTLNSLITRPDHVVKLLGYSWNGIAWVDSGAFDLTTFTSLYSTAFVTNYARLVQGFIGEDVSLADLIGTIVSEMGCALVPLSNGKLALWPWGTTSAVTKVFTDADIVEIGQIQETDPSTVINNVTVEYGKNFTNVFDQYEASGKPENRSGVLVISKDTSGYYYGLLNKSESLYSKRQLEDSGTQFIGDASTALSRAMYYILRHDHPHRTFDVTIPYFDNSTLKLMDIVDIESVHLPAHFGTSSKARLPTYTGIEVDVYKGEYPRQVQRRRCQIIGLSNDYDGSYPRLVMTVREIKGRHKNDPTAENL